MIEHRCRILVIDDQAAIREVVADLIREIELADDVEVACSIHEATQLLQGGVWDAVVTDMSLSDGNILDLIESMQLHGYLFPPILLMSGFLFGKSQQRAVALGVEYILPKPFVPNELIDCLQRALAQD